MPRSRRHPDSPSQRFLRVVQHPDVARKAGGSSGMTGVIRVRHNAPQAAEALGELSRRVPTSLIKNHQDQAAALQARLRALAAIAYTSGTGRFARGIYAKVRELENGAAIIITVMNYRETRFLTNLGGRGYFRSKSYPVPPYTIYAKGAEGAKERVDPLSGKLSSRRTKHALTIARRSAVGRLKIPKAGTFFVSQRRPGRGGGESRTISGMPLDTTPGNIQTNSQFFYPLWVDHPGFARDVLSDAVAQEQARYINDVQTLIRFEHQNLGQGRFKSTPKEVTRADQDIERVVSNVIPLQPVSVTLARGRLTRRAAGYGSVDATGLQLLKRSTDVL